MSANNQNLAGALSKRDSTLNGDLDGKSISDSYGGDGNGGSISEDEEEEEDEEDEEEQEARRKKEANY
jgi:hypothetical protein